MKIFRNAKLLKILLILLSIPTAILLVKYMPMILELTVSLDSFNKYIISLGSVGALVFVLFQAIQIVIAPIPGEVIQVAGGYIYGTSLGLLYSILGMLIGSLIAFYFTRLIGKDLIEKLLENKNAEWISKIMKSNKFPVILFFVFVVPGLPKDFLIYAAGLTPIKSRAFFAILIAARTPWILASVCVGCNIHYGNYISSIIISLVALILFIIGFFNKDKIISSVS